MTTNYLVALTRAGGSIVLSTEKLRAIAGFARLVDAMPQVKALVAAAKDVHGVVEIARQQGFGGVTPELLVEVAGVLEASDWVWRGFGQRWSDNAYVLSLAMLLRAKEWKAAKSLRQPRSPACRQDQDLEAQIEARRFYAYARADGGGIQAELSKADSLVTVISIARSHGFCMRQVDFLLNKHEWCDSFFPWGGRSPSEVRMLMHAKSFADHHPGEAGIH